MFYVRLYNTRFAGWFWQPATSAISVTFVGDRFIVEFITPTLLAQRGVVSF